MKLKHQNTQGYNRRDVVWGGVEMYKINTDINHYEVVNDIPEELFTENDEFTI